MDGLQLLFCGLLVVVSAQLILSDDVDGGDIILPCSIPNEPDDGVCIRRSQCAAYSSAADFRPLKSDRLSFLKQVQCNANANEPFVCCPLNAGNYSMPVVQLNEKKRKLRNSTESADEASLTSRFSGATACGIQSYQNRIQGGDISELDEFPWVALLFHALKQDPSKHEHVCGGVLVSPKFVITAAHCLVGEVTQIKGELKFVRLGEYNLDDNPDCIQELDEEDCADPPMDFSVVRKLIHPMYNPRSQNHHHDLAILKLRQPAPTTPFIRPICLPQTQGQPFNTFFVAGWGRTGFNAPPSPYKMRVQLPFVEKQTCARVYMTERLEITTGQICAGGKKGYDACLGDSGSPLMYTKNGARWELVGVVSLGFKNCGLEGVPGVYTYVHNYMDWINSNIVD